jgi:hypothetical protein
LIDLVALRVVGAVLSEPVEVVVEPGLGGGKGLLGVLVLLGERDVRLHGRERGGDHEAAHQQRAHQRDRREALLAAVDQTHSVAPWS